MRRKPRSKITDVDVIPKNREHELHAHFVMPNHDRAHQFANTLGLETREDSAMAKEIGENVTNPQPIVSWAQQEKLRAKLNSAILA